MLTAEESTEELGERPHEEAGEEVGFEELDMGGPAYDCVKVAAMGGVEADVTAHECSFLPCRGSDLVKTLVEHLKEDEGFLGVVRGRCRGELDPR